MKFIYLFTFIIFLNFASAQKIEFTYYNVHIPILEPIDSNFYSMLDYILEIDKNCTFFSDSIWYSLSLDEAIKSDTNYLFFNFEPNEIKSFFLENDFEMYKGIVKHKNHCFFISINSSDIFFKQTREKHHICGFFQKSTNRIDDSWPIHEVEFFDGDYYYIKSIRQNIRCP